MNSVQSVIGNLAELFMWVGLVLGALCFLVLLVLRAVRGHQVVSEAVLAETPAGTHLRWLAADGLLRSRPLADFEVEQVGDLDELHVYYHERSPDVVQLQAIDHAESVLRLLGVIFLSVAGLAIVVSLVALLLP